MNEIKDLLNHFEKFLKMIKIRCSYSGSDLTKKLQIRQDPDPHLEFKNAECRFRAT